MATLAFGSIIARIIGIASTPIITRLYSPSDFGILSVFSSALAILGPMMTLRYLLAIPLPRRDGTAANLVAASLLISASTSIIAGLLIFSFSNQIFTALNISKASQYWWLLILALILYALYETLSMWSTRKRNYKLIARTQVQQSLAGTALKISLGLFSLQPLGLLLGQTAATSAGIGTMAKSSFGELSKKLHQITISRIIKILRIYIDYPIYRLPSQFLLAFSAQAPLLICANMYNTEITGQFGLAIMTLMIPINLLGQTLSKAYYAEIAAIGSKHPKIIYQITISILKKLFIISILPTAAIFFYAPPIFKAFFGEAWELSGVIASNLSIYLIFQFLQAPVAHLLYVFNGQRLLLIINAQRALIVASSFLIARHYSLSLEETITLYASLLAIHYFLSIAFALKIIPLDERK